MIFYVEKGFFFLSIENLFSRSSITARSLELGQLIEDDEQILKRSYLFCFSNCSVQIWALKHG